MPWAAWLEAWAIPEHLVAQAPATPYFFDPAVFIAAAEDALERPVDSPSDRIAREALPRHGTVLDVGSGAGAASLRLDAARVVAVDLSGDLLLAFSELAARRGVPADTIAGRWPDVAGRTPVADVAVCHHVAYNVPDLTAFVAALTDHARERVVMELTALHPLAWMSPYWAAMHSLQQPSRPTADDAIAEIEGTGLQVQVVRWTRPMQMIGEGGDDDVARIARRLCLPADRHDELRALLAQTPPPRERDVVTIWWDGQAPK